MTLPVVEPDLSTTDDDLTHLVCCDPDLSLCGLDLTGGEDVPEPPDAEQCEICANKDRLDLPCGARFCRLRQRWRGRS
jgi:hypothetical protein